MSEQVQSILEGVLKLTAEQQKELIEALAQVGSSRPNIAVSRRELVLSIKGRYRHVDTSSEAFMSRKKEELELESRP